MSDALQTAWTAKLVMPMSARQKANQSEKFVQEWTLSPSASFGSAIRAKGILQELRARLQLTVRKLLHLEAMVICLRMPEGADDDFRAASATVSKILAGIESLPIIPREVEDILAISAAERHRWLKDGRLHSAGTRTVKLHGRAKQITFHVFDPHHIEDVLDRDLTTVWREQDATTAAENRRRSAGKAALARAQKSVPNATPATGTAGEISHQSLQGWEEFESDGFLR